MSGGVMLLILFFLLMLIGIPLYASLLFVGFLGVVGGGNLTLMREIGRAHV